MTVLREEGDDDDQNVDHCRTSAIAHRSGAKNRIKFRRRGLLFFTALCTFFFAGAPSGWGPMQIMLRNDGAFAYLCDDQEEEEEEDLKRERNATATTTERTETPTTTESSFFCADQISSILNVPFFAYFAMVTSPLFGHVADDRGPIALTTICAVLGVAGIGLLVASRTVLRNDADDRLLYVAFTLIMTACTTTSILIVETGMVFDDDDDDDHHHDSSGDDDAVRDEKRSNGDDDSRRRVISFLNALFDAGTIMYLVLWQIQKTSGVSLSTVLLGYLVVAVLVYGGALFFWTSLRTHLLSKKNDEEHKINGSLDEAHNNTNVDDDDDEEVDHEGIEEQPGDTEEHSSETYVLIADRPPLQQLRSLQFVMMTIFFALHELRIIFILASAENFLRYLGDDRSRYLTVFTCLLPVSLVAVPFVDYCFRRFGYYTMFQLVNLLGLIHGVVQVSFESLDVQVFGFVAFSFYRCFLFSVIFSYLPVFLGKNALGKGNGLMTLFAAPVGPLAVPMADFAVKRRNGNFFVPNLINLSFIVPLTLVAYSIGRTIRKEERRKRC